ncbi:MAG: M1 family peptidase [Bacteroidetes bacterium]|nr:M1 family peptidase [Bacteroidota bacterium]
MKKTILILLSIATLTECSVFRKNSYEWAVDSAAVDTAIAVMDATWPDWTGENEILPSNYRAARYSDWDLQHTNLYVSFDFAKKQLNGEAEITMKLHFYETDSIVLDAKNMDIESVQIKLNGNWQTANFTYPDSLKLVIKPGITFTSANPIANLRIKYTAKPYAAEVEGGSAITQDRGLYFINPDGSDPLKPRQIWTQGETESNSRWFPTIDAPNQKMTQRICMTIPDSMVSLSNGLKISIQKNNSGTRTDCWEQKLPHAPYLAMMAIGDWAEIQDKWRDKPVTYLVEKLYASRAKQIFGKTPEMMEFFSTYTGVDFPWDKYSQVVVRDFVSGAMENTSATVHMENLQTTEEEYRDETYEDYVSHELFHHWFGDLVTAESWSNITLNESFATYGEYLWREHKYGKAKADELLEEFRLYTRLNDVMGGADKKLVRYQYHRYDDVFDVVSYQKGALILHMLRQEIGDAAFREGMKKYLTDNRFRAAEVDHLRLAMEAVTGRDLHPFFNQWYFTGNQPEINVSSSWDSINKTIRFDIDQTQNHRNTYVLKTKILFTIKGKTHIQPVVINKRNQSFTFPLSEQPKFWLLDPDNQLLCKINYPNEGEAPNPLETLQKAMQTLNNPALQLAVFDRAVALFPDNDSELNETADSIVIAALQSNWSPLLNTVLDHCTYRTFNDSNAIKNNLHRIIFGNFDSDVREKALTALEYRFPTFSSGILPRLTSDPSPKVALNAINYIEWKEQFADTARFASQYATKAIAAKWMKKWMEQDSGTEPLKYMLLLQKNPKAGLACFENVFSNWFFGAAAMNVNDFTKTQQMEFIAEALTRKENKSMLKIAAGIIKPALEVYSEEDKPAWFSVAEKLVKAANQ